MVLAEWGQQPLATIFPEQRRQLGDVAGDAAALRPS
jgi:hypothetical protein